MKKVTIVKSVKGGETLRLTSVEELTEQIRQGKYEKEAGVVRDIYPLMSSEEAERNFFRYNREAQRLPRICFAQSLENRNHQRQRLAYTGMVLLEVNNLTGYEETAAVRRGAGMMPQTLMAFVGVSGRSVNIVCRGELFPDLVRDGSLLPTDEAAIVRFHQNLYERARMFYSGQLGVTVERREPSIEQLCYMAHDVEAVCNPMALPFYVQADRIDETVSVVRQSSTEPDELLPGKDRYSSLKRIYEFNSQKAYDAVEGIVDEEERTHLYVTALASYCSETGIPMGMAQRLALFESRLSKNEDLVRLVFANAYHEEHDRQYRRRKKIERPLKNIPPEALLTKKIEIFLNTNYELRKNVMRGVAEYRWRTGLGYSFTDLTEEARNSITMRALEQGIKCWDKDIRRYVNSEDIEQYDPMNDFLEHLPRWDGKDRVTEMARRVPCDYPEWEHLFHLWMRSMVAMWTGRGQLTGNALVPLLIGRQGCGKSSFCRIILPRDQREYYNDRINFKNESDLNLGLTSFALINLDEFDKITKRQQIVLKYLVSTSDLKYRPPYGKAYSAHRRYASFIGTTNDPAPLTDPSGSRRFVCVTVSGDIDFTTPVDYPQLYAQLKEEISHGERYWMTKEEEQALMAHNLRYQQLSGLSEMLAGLFVPAVAGDPEGQWMTLPMISEKLKERYGSSYEERPGMFEKIGTYFNRPEVKCEKHRKTSGMEYFVKVRS